MTMVLEKPPLIDQGIIEHTQIDKSQNPPDIIKWTELEAVCRTAVYLTGFKAALERANHNIAKADEAKARDIRIKAIHRLREQLSQVPNRRAVVRMAVNRLDIFEV